MTPKHLESDSPDDESPEADEAWFRRARPALDVLRDLFGDPDTARMTGQNLETSTGSEGLDDSGTDPTVPTHRLT
jgi:hypothetical protein